MKHNIFVLFIFSTFSFLKGYTQTLFEKGYLEYKSGSLDSSVKLFTQSIEKQENIINSTLYRGAALTFLGKYVEAEFDLKTVEKMAPSTTKLHYYYGKYYLLTGKYKDAIKHFTIELQKNPSDAAAYGDRGNTKLILGDFEGAIADESKAIELDSLDNMFYNDRGYAKIKLNDFNNALTDFEMSLRLQPNQKAYTNSGLAYCLLGLHNEAIERYSKALQLLPDDAETIYLRGFSYKQLGNIVEACKDFKKSMLLNYANANKEYEDLKCH